MKPKLLIVSGPTATGKTALSLQLAKELNGELISADSRQVFAGMDIITGKDVTNCRFSKAHEDLQRNIQAQLNFPITIGTYNLDGIDLWGLDLVKPDQFFDISHFILIAKAILSDIWSRGKLPIIVGGTGFYLKGLINPMDTVGIPINNPLRNELESQPLPDLQEKLQHTDYVKWHSMNHSDQYNPRRLIRAIEVAEYRKQMQSSENHNEFTPLDADMMWIGLTATKEVLSKRITERVSQRVSLGAEKEVRSLLEQGYSWQLPSMSAIGYGEWKDYIEHHKTLEETLRLWELHEIQYAKRQMTWFTKEPLITWFSVTDSAWVKSVKLHIQKWRKNS